MQTGAHRLAPCQRPELQQHALHVCHRPLADLWRVGSVGRRQRPAPASRLRGRFTPLVAAAAPAAAAAAPAAAAAAAVSTPQFLLGRAGCVLSAAAGASQLALERAGTLLASLAGTWWALAAAVAAGAVLGLALSKAVSAAMASVLDPDRTSAENAQLRAKVEDLTQVVLALQPSAYKNIGLRFRRGVNKGVLLGMIDGMLQRREVNIWWIPDSLERLLYLNMMTLMLAVLDEVVDAMSIQFAGHNVKLTLTYLDVADEGEPGSAAAAKTQALLAKALEPL